MAYKVFLLATIYYFACGLSALVAPWLWTVVTGVNLDSAPLALQLIGVLFLSLSVGAFIASREPRRHVGIGYVLLAANVLDLLLVIKALVLAELPPFQGTALFGIDLFWCVLLMVTLRRLGD